MPINIARLGNPCERFPSLIKTSALPNHGTKHKPKCLETLDRVYKSDTTVPIPDNLTEALQEFVAPHADVLEDSKDWHPRCDQQVLGRVHPSIYPLVYGQSRILATATVGLNDRYSAVARVKQSSYQSRILWRVSDRGMGATLPMVRSTIAGHTNTNGYLLNG